MDFTDAINYVTSAAASTGQFDAVMGHEPKAAPARTGLTAAAFIRDWRPVQSSGLAALSMRYQVNLRVFTSMLQEPQDEIDIRVMRAVDAVLAAIAADFEGPSGSRYVDLLGSEGEEISAQMAYADQDGKKFRIADILVPVIINDVYPLAP